MPPEAASCLATMNRAPAVPMKVTFMASRFRNLGQRLLRRLPEVTRVQLLDAFQRVDLVDRLVVADADDAWESHGVPARVAAGPLDGVEGHLEHDLRLDDA